jgi:hypothetical protein
MFWLTETNMSCNNLSAIVTHEHADSASSPTHLQLMGRSRKLGEPSMYIRDTHGTRGPGCWGHIMKSRSKLPLSSPSRGPAPTTLTPIAPCDAPLALAILGTSATTGRGEPGVMTARSPALVVDDTIKGSTGMLSGAPQTDGQSGLMRHDSCHHGTTF